MWDKKFLKYKYKSKSNVAQIDREPESLFPGFLFEVCFILDRK